MKEAPETSAKKSSIGITRTFTIFLQMRECIVGIMQVYGLILYLRMEVHNTQRQYFLIMSYKTRRIEVCKCIKYK